MMNLGLGVNIDKEEHIYKNHRFARLDLHGKSKSDPDIFMVWIRNEFAKAGIVFPVFDIALALLWESSRAEQEFPKLTNGFLSKSKKTLEIISPDLIKSGIELASETLESIPGLGPSLQKLGGWVFDKSKTKYLEGTRDHFKALYSIGSELKKPYELAQLLPVILAKELNYYLDKNPEERFVLLIDAYESVLDGAGTGRMQENLFDRRLRTFISEVNGLLAIFFSREKLHWAQDNDWVEDLKGVQHLLGGLSEKDAQSWLDQIPLEDKKICKAIIASASVDGTAGHPLLLDLLVEHWRELVAKGSTITSTQFQLREKTFEGRAREMVESLLRDYDLPVQSTLKNLSIAQRFDKKSFFHVVKIMGTALPHDQFENMTKLSFITQGEDGYFSIHKAVSEIISTSLDETQKEKARACLFEHFEQRATVSSPKDITEQTINALLEASYLRRQIGLEGYVDWLAPISKTISDAARYIIGEQIWREALALTEEYFDEGHLDTAISYNNLAYNLNLQGRYQEAETLYHKAMDIRKYTLGVDHPDTAQSYNNLATNLDARGRHQEAETLHRKAMNIYKRRLGEACPNTAQSYNNLAANLDAQGRHQEAETLHRKALGIREHELGVTHPNTAQSYNNLAYNLNSQRRNEEAEPLFRKALGIREHELGVSHPDTAQSYNNLAYNLSTQKRYKEEEELHRKSLDIKKHSLGGNHPSTAMSYNNLACNLDNQGHHKEAEPLYHKALEILGIYHSDTAQIYNNLAYNLDDQGLHEDAEPLYRKALDISERTLGGDHPQTKAIRDNLEANLKKGKE